ncbi:MAG TPA: condensation domain-containing protein, partial [Eubacteriales bacterium]|nr:condensation domain-containing protein [Eubacteriales bacterium]
MKKTYKAELWDTIHKFFGDYNDHMMHAVLETDGKLDIELFKRAFAAATEVFPLFLTRFRAGLFRSKWVETDLAPEDAVQVIEGAELSDKERFLTSKIAEKKGPQVKIAIFRGEESDTVCFLINHMLFDGAAFKEWLALLSRCYTNLKYNPNYKDSFTSGSRKFSELYDGFSLSDKIKSAAMVDYGKKNAEKRGFPFEKAVYGSPMILTRAIDNGRFTALKAFSKKYGFTVNDVILAAYARAMARLTEGSS